MKDVFPVREKSGNFEILEKVREKLGIFLSGKSQGIIMTCYFADLPVHLILFFFSWAHTCAERAKLGLVPLDTVVLGLLLPGPHQW